MQNKRGERASLLTEKAVMQDGDDVDKEVFKRIRMDRRCSGED